MAAGPVNAMLNYGYTLGESVARHACQIVGLDPALGVMHTDKPHRDSLALDLLEALRPTIDRTALQLLASRRFCYLNFTGTPQGQVRLTETVTYPLAASMPAWVGMLAHIVERVAHDLTGSAPSSVSARTPLIRGGPIAANRKPTSRRIAKPATHPAPTSSCRDGGTALAEQARELGPACWVPERAQHATQRAEHGPASRPRTSQTTGIDPTQTATSRQKRSAQPPHRTSLTRRLGPGALWSPARPKPVRGRRRASARLRILGHNRRRDRAQRQRRRTGADGQVNTPCPTLFSAL